MLPGFLERFAGKLVETLGVALPAAAVGAAVFTALAFCPGQACNPGRNWWRNPGLLTDLCYFLVVPFIAPYLRAALMLVGAGFFYTAYGALSGLDVLDYFERGLGPLAGLPFAAQCAAYVVASDFLLYWSHRAFHRWPLWRYHAIHHSAEHVDWTTAYRSHPVNLLLGSYLATAVMIYLGVPMRVIAFWIPFDIALSYFVHANLNWSFGPLKYVVATPVFHRWHHTAREEGGDANFAPLFSLWDVIFGTFHMPANARPERYPVEDPLLPQSFLGQLVYPARRSPAGSVAQGEAIAAPAPEKP